MPFSIRTEGQFSHRDDVIERAADFWGEGKTDAVIRSCEEGPQSVRARRQALEVLAREIDPELLDEVVSLLETSHVSFDWEISGRGLEDVHVDVETRLNGD